MVTHSRSGSKGPKTSKNTPGAVKDTGKGPGTVGKGTKIVGNVSKLPGKPSGGSKVLKRSLKSIAGKAGTVVGGIVTSLVVKNAEKGIFKRVRS